MILTGQTSAAFLRQSVSLVFNSKTSPFFLEFLSVALPSSVISNISGQTDSQAPHPTHLDRSCMIFTIELEYN
ncbi:MAG: hypothetical protein Athens071426_551 [Parcubacteria group bacterium Athens0714_26]|nr:MAG: hypothetical protein Athens071426_551 [Parcubacteria group bacterium Athens0714_26]